MKILFIHRPSGHPFTERIHSGLVNKLKEFNHQIFYVPQKGEGEVDLDKINKKYNPELVLAYCSRRLNTYIKDGEISIFKCPKILFEVDYFKVLERNWLYKYKAHNFDLIIQRASFDKNTNTTGIPMILLPFSADETTEFKTAIPFKDKIKKIGFVGSINKYYFERCKMKEKIWNKRDIFSAPSKKYLDKGYEYSDFLKKHIGIINTSEINVAYGKFFEIIAAGSALLTTRFDDIDLMFRGNKDTHFEFKKDSSDLEEKCRYMIKNLKYTEKVAENGRKIFLENHTHSIRVRELNSHIENLCNGKELIRYWY